MISGRTSIVLSLLGLGIGCGPTPSTDDVSGRPAVTVPDFPAQNRPDVRGTTAAVSSGHPLASAAGYAVLLEGGNAVDAAVTMAGVLAVVRPHMNGVGGDAFALFYDAATSTVTALNGSGRAGALAVPSFFSGTGDEPAEVPDNGPRSVSVPGAVAAWADALDRYGTITLTRALAPAIRYARDGFPVSTRLHRDFEAQGGVLNEAGQAQYLPGGAPPVVGTLLKNPALAATLERIAARGKGGFYEGPVAETLTDLLEAQGGYLRASDLASHTTTWVEPLTSDYRGLRILVMPPNTQGFAQLQQMVMAETFDLAAMERNSADYLHTLIEIKKIAFADRNLWAADPEHTQIPLDRLLAPDYLLERASLVDPGRAALDVAPGISVSNRVAAQIPGEEDDGGDTVYLTVVDQWGNAVSWIQSLFAGFGSGIFEPTTGVMLHNRGALFTLEEGHPNQIAPGKRPYHTLTPMMALRSDGQLAFTMGTPGGDSQTQSLLAITNNLLLFGMTPQEAIEAPRYRSYPGARVALEDRIPASVIELLRARGHEIDIVHGWTATFGGAQMIHVDPATGVRTAASDPRREAYGIAY